MIAKGQSIRHLRASIGYAMRREQAVVLDKNIVAESPRDVAKEFKSFQDLNSRCVLNNFSFVLSPTVQDGQHLSEAHLRHITSTFLDKMDLSDHQYIAFVHQNTPHKHVHLYVNRINYQGKAHDDRFISNRSARVAEGIAQEFGLRTARHAKLLQMREQHLKVPELAEVKHLAHRTLQQTEIHTVDQFIASFNRSGAAQGFRSETYHSKNGFFGGVRFYVGEQRFKASEVDRSLSKQQLEKKLAMHQDISQERDVSQKRTRGMGL